MDSIREHLCIKPREHVCTSSTVEFDSDADDDVSSEGEDDAASVDTDGAVNDKAVASAPLAEAGAVTSVGAGSHAAAAALANQKAGKGCLCIGRRGGRGSGASTAL